MLSQHAPVPCGGLPTIVAIIGQIEAPSVLAVWEMSGF